MTNRELRLSRIRAAVVALLGAGMVACGGGGSDGGTPPAPTLIDLTAANMQTVAHAAAAGPYAFGSTGNASVLGAAQGGAAGASGVASHVLAALVPARQAAPAEGRAHALAFYPGQPEACPQGGTVTLGIDDADNDGQFDAGDTMTFAFDQCRSADEITTGRTAVKLTRVETGPAMAFGARMTISSLTVASADGRHTVTTDGSAWMDYAQLDAARERLRMTADGTVTVRVHTHQGVNDSVGLQDGYTYESVLDGAARTMTDTFDGHFHSAAAGGMARTRTDSALQSRENDPFPWTGTLRVNGQHGTLLVRSLSTDQVRLELDHNDCGVAEQTQTEAWDWLM
jgi:hypothetical protein